MAVDWNTPGLTSNYATEVLQFLKGRDENIGKMDFTGDSNLPTGFVKADSADSYKLKRWTGAAFSTLPWHTTIDSHIADASIHQPAVPGAIIMYAGAAAPSGYLLCDGTAVSRTTYAALFAVTGVAFGAGNGSTTFNLPDLRGRFALGKAASGTGSTLGATGGSLDHTHTGPSHTHTVAAHSHDMGSHTHNTQDHSHTNVAHTHTVPAHYHAATGNGADINIASSGSHQHNIDSRENGATGTGNQLMEANNLGSSTVNTVNNATSNHIHANSAFAGRVGNVSSGNNGDGTLTTGSGGGANTGSIVGSPPATLGPSTNTTSSTALTTDAGGTGSTGGANPAYQVINYIIKT